MTPILMYSSLGGFRTAGTLGNNPAVVALMLAIFCYIFIVPEKEKRNEPFKSNKFFCVLHDIFKSSSSFLRRSSSSSTSSPPLPASWPGSSPCSPRAAS
ncbi:MAG: hypothetical protein IJM85_01325 [Clostridia bacterium]|nr:hypothetical protein [Clostridia bacterium]